jgi:hypothetical protein
VFVLDYLIGILVSLTVVVCMCDVVSIIWSNLVCFRRSVTSVN